MLSVNCTIKDEMWSCITRKGIVCGYLRHVNVHGMLITWNFIANEYIIDQRIRKHGVYVNRITAGGTYQRIKDIYLIRSYRENERRIMNFKRDICSVLLTDKISTKITEL